MPNKKTIRRNKRNSKRSRSRNRKGGFFGLFDDKHNTGNADCNPNNLANLKSSIEIKKNIDTCCPKNWYGRKNNSPYCKQLNLNYDAALTKMHLKAQQSNANGVYLDNDDPDGLRDSDVAHLEGALYQHNTVGTSQINCKDKNFPNKLTDQNKMETYIETCECNKSRWNPFSDKKANCAIVKRKLEETKQQNEASGRDTEVFNPIQQNNQYMPVSQTDIENEASERDTEVFNPIQQNNQYMPVSQYEAQEIPREITNQYQNIQPQGYNRPSFAEGGKRRKTKKHFKKRSIRKRSIRKQKGRNSKRRKH